MTTEVEARANDEARRNAVIRMDRMAFPGWRALSDEVKAEIEGLIPEGTVLTCFGTYLSRHTTFTARLMRGSKVIAQVERAPTVEWGCRRVLAVGVGLYEPDPDWEEDEEGFVTAPLSYENREGDPTLNGAFDKW